MKRIGFVSLILGLALLPLAATATPILQLPDGGSNSHEIELLSGNVFDGSFYVWTYKVTSGSGNTVHSISHWVIGICADYFDHATDSGGTDISLIIPPDTDPTLGIAGLKFDDEYDDDDDDREMRTVRIYMTQSLETTEVEVGIKSGHNLYYGTIDGPSCNSHEVPEPSTIALVTAGVLGLTSRRKTIL